MEIKSESKHLPGRHRQSTHGGDGAGLPDALGLAGVIDLDPGETLIGSAKVSGDFGTVRLAVTERGGARSLRIGIGGADFGGRHDEAGPWTAGPAPTDDTGPAGFTARLDEAAVRELSATLADAVARAAARESDDTRDYDVFAEGVVAGEWADVHYLVYLDEPSAGTGVQVQLAAVPPGVDPVADVRDLERDATFDPAETRRLLRQLHRMFPDDSDSAASSRPAGKWGGPVSGSVKRVVDSAGWCGHPRRETGGPVRVKALSDVEIKSESKGEVVAVIATFGVVDSDGDVTHRGAFEGNGDVPLGAWNHSSWSGVLPVGVGRIRETTTEGVFEGRFFIDQESGWDHYETIKGLGSVCQWSYGFQTVDGEPGEHLGRKVRHLYKQLVDEVCPTLRGSGVNTRTVDVKGRQGVTLGLRRRGATTPRELLEVHRIGQDVQLRSELKAIHDRWQHQMPRPHYYVEAGPPSPQLHAAALDMSNYAAAQVGLRYELPRLGWIKTADAELAAWVHERGVSRAQADLDLEVWSADEPIRGLYHPRTNKISIRDDLPFIDAMATVVHEVGHAAGLSEEDCRALEDPVFDRQWWGAAA